MPLYTIGHSTRTYAELVAALHAHDIDTLADVRRFARSRTNPQFNGDALAKRLPAAGIAYTTMPTLGGRRSTVKKSARATRRNAAWRVPAFRAYADYCATPEWRAAFGELLALAEERTVAIMCAEAVWWRCHRRIIADHALARGLAVVHIFSATKAEPATLTPFGRVARGAVTYPLRDGDVPLRRAAARAERRRPRGNDDGRRARPARR
jgi:uncharacterized protein (DUF488 family)